MIISIIIIAGNTSFPVCKSAVTFKHSKVLTYTVYCWNNSIPRWQSSLVEARWKARWYYSISTFNRFSNVFDDNHTKVTILEVLRAYQHGLGSAFSVANPGFKEGWPSFTCHENDRAWMGWKPAPGWPFNGSNASKNARGCQYMIIYANTMYAKNTEEKWERYDMAITV